MFLDTKYIIMALISFKDWMESSASTRQRDGWARGLYPPTAGVMSRSTPSPFIMKKAIEEFGCPEHPKKRKRKKGKRKKGK